ncbi:hypothetical protein BC940DRAFT_152033 [Gongronella butleri]|nr:hypothetical protein BC940DRAFT_152033 [Gongronella butleri]
MPDLPQQQESSSSSSGSNSGATRGWATVHNSRTRAGEATRTFLSHVQSYVLGLPLMTRATVFVSVAISGVDLALRILNWNTIYELFRLSMIQVIYQLQVHRVLVYPFVASFPTFLITDLILLIPYLAQHEQAVGTLPIVYELVSLYTVVPAVVYVVLVWLVDSLSTNWLVGFNGCAGLSGWVIGLAIGTMLRNADRPTQHSLFGLIPIPPHLLPWLIILFYLFLVPDTSLILHLVIAAISYLYHTRQWPRVWTPCPQMYQRIEQHPQMGFLTMHPNFVKTGSYLPVSTSDSSPSSVAYVGQGQRLGDE